MSDDETTTEALRRMRLDALNTRDLAHGIQVTWDRGRPRSATIRQLASIVEDFAAPLARVIDQLQIEIVKEKTDLRRASEPPQCDHLLPDQCDLCRGAP